MKKATRFPSWLLVGSILMLVPSASALQGGPVMPEYVQFEPVDAPDVVNLNSGDFSYSLPLGEVPGPYGGYPLNMSYHAGIGPNQEATWVGLGWTLNPGAINRTLRGTPDDQFHGGDLSFIYSYSTSSTFSVGYTLGYSGNGLDMRYDSHAGYGINAHLTLEFFGAFNAGVDFGTSGVGVHGGAGASFIGVNGSIMFTEGGMNVGASVGIQGPGGVTLGASVGVHYTYGGKIAATGGFGVSTESGTGIQVSSDGSVAISVGAGGKDGLKGTINLSSKGISASVGYRGTGLSLAGASSSGPNSSVSTASIMFPIGPGFFDYSRSNQESWLQAATSEHNYGYMYQAGPAILVDGLGNDYGSPEASQNQGAGGSEIAWNWNFKGRNLDNLGNPMKGPMFPAYDIMTVSAQGVTGSFRAQAASKHRIHISAETLPGGVEEDPNPLLLYYLLSQDAQGRQKVKDFDVSEENDPTGAIFTKYAYDYCSDFESDRYHVNYIGGQSETDRYEAMRSETCSRYAIMKSNHLNEGNRLVFAADRYTNLDNAKKFRSRMSFRFIGEPGGYYADAETEPSAKLGRDDINSDTWNRDLQGWDTPIYGNRRIDPILEDDATTGRLKGFKITGSDGTQYMFEKPVRSLMSASYTTNQPVGGPAFIDRHRERDRDDFLDILGNTWGSFVDILSDDPVGQVRRLGRWAEAIADGAIGLVSSFLFHSPDFRTACDVDDSISNYNYSYQMSTNPYATQWLLTEIRGSDFVEMDRFDMDRNFGYQVRFNYTNPAHYNWRLPYARPGLTNKELPNLRVPKTSITAENCASEMYQASFGVKELVYLSSIETATHIADFHLNDPAQEPRVDAKGWIYNWSGEGLPSADRTEGLPVMVGVHFYLERLAPSTVSPATYELWKNEVRNQQRQVTAPAEKIGSLGWQETPETYLLGNVFLDIQPTQEQIDKIIGSEITIGGFEESATNAPLDVAAGYYLCHNPTGSAECQADASGFLEKNRKKLANRGYVVYEAPAVSGKNKAKVVTARVISIDRAVGPEQRFGSYKLTLDTDGAERIELTGGSRLQFAVRNNDGNVIPAAPYFPNFGSVGEPLPLLSDGKYLDVTSGGGHFSHTPFQPLLVFNSFIDFNEEENANQNRYLKSIDFARKDRESEPTRRFVFNYDNEISPKTLNSYNLDPTLPGSVFDRMKGSYPIAANGDGLQGKLKLKSVTEIACAGFECEKQQSLPPFRFQYFQEKQTPFQAGQTLDESILFSTHTVDEWGYFHPDATLENNKVRPGSKADAVAAFWSLNKIVDPTGGVMEVEYERDTYSGESYAQDELAMSISWNQCSTDPTKVCVEYLPRKWDVYCDRKDKLKGEYRFVFDPAEAQGTFDYMTRMGFVKDAGIIFDFKQRVETEVGCGINIGVAKSHGCDRTLSVDVIGTGIITDVSQQTSSTSYPVFDAQGYAEGGATCSVRGTCCSDSFFGSKPYWHCGLQAIRVETDIPYEKLMNQIGATADKARPRDWSPDGQRLGVVWARRPVETLQGGGLRVKRLIKKDMGLVQTTQYDYGVGELAQYPDSVMSRAFASRFATGKMTDVFGADPDDVPSGVDPRFRELPGMSRVDGIGDEDLNLLPGPNISYSAVTVRNVLEEGSQVKEANGKTVYRFLGPERKGGLRLRIEPFQVASGSPSKLTVEFLDGANPPVPVFIRKLLHPRNNGNQVYFEDFQPSQWNHRVADIRALRFSYGSPVETVSIPFNSQGMDIAEFTLTGSYNGSSLNLAQVGPPILTDFEFPAILAKQNIGGVAVYDDYTSRLGRSMSTTYFRNIGSTENPDYLMIKKDSAVYKHAAPSIDNRFVPSATASKLGSAKESWQYTRVRRCYTGTPSGDLPNCEDNEDDSKWKGFKPSDFDGTAKQARHVVHSTFAKESWSFSGFAGSRQETPPGVTDFLITRTTSHRFNAVTGQPTLTVTYGGSSPKDPSKATRMTPAFQVDPTTLSSAIPNAMFGLNMLDQNFREDVFTHDVATTETNAPSGNAINFDQVNLGGTEQDNGGFLAPRLTSVKITPFSQGLISYPVEPGRPDPILSLGNFTSKFDNVTELSRTRENRALVAVQPDLSYWNGVRIAKLNKFRKPLQIEDAYNRPTTNRFDQSGFRQIGLFANAGYNETAVLVPEELDFCSDLGPKVGKWYILAQSACGSLESGYLHFPYNLDLRHSLDVVQGGKYVVEWQAHTTGSRVIRVALVADDGRVGDEEEVTLSSGLSKYSATLDVSSGFGTSVPGTGQCKLFFQGLSGPLQGQVRINYIRAYPEQSQSMIYVYNGRGDMTQKVDETGLSSYYEYDLFGKLIAIRNDDGQILGASHKELVNVSNE